MLVLPPHVRTPPLRPQPASAGVQILVRALVNVDAAAVRISCVARLAGAVPAARQVGAVRVGRAVVAALRALVLVPATRPRRVLHVAGDAGTGEAAVAVGAGGEVPAVAGPVHPHVVDVALVVVQASWLGLCRVAVKPSNAVFILRAANMTVPADVVKLGKSITSIAINNSTFYFYRMIITFDHRCKWQFPCCTYDSSSCPSLRSRGPPCCWGRARWGSRPC